MIQKLDKVLAWAAAQHRLATLAFAAGWIGVGVICLVSGDFLLQWQPVPAGLPHRAAIATLAAILLIGCGLMLAFSRTRRAAAIILAFDLTASIILQIAVDVGRPLTFGEWVPVAENLVLLCALLILISAKEQTPGLATGERMTSLASVARYVFALCLLLFGVSHIVYLDFTAKMVPAWMPARPALAAFTGACHFAAGLGIFTRRFAVPAALLEALMMGLFVLLLHIPSVLSVPPWFAPTPQKVWTSLFVASLLTSAAAIMAVWLARADAQRVIGGRAIQPRGTS